MTVLELWVGFIFIIFFNTAATSNFKALLYYIK